MLAVFLVLLGLIVPFVVVFFAIRYVLEWTLSPLAFRAVCGFTSKAFDVSMKLLVVAGGASIIIGVSIFAWSVSHHPPV